jgi:mannosyltransferase
MMSEEEEFQREALAGTIRRVPGFIWFLCILAFALAIRLHALVADGLWYDELLTVVRAYPSLRTAVTSMWQQSSHPPLYQVQLHFWMRFGTSDFWIRLNPLLWSVLSLVSLYLLARRTVSERVALVASLFVALSPLHVYYAQEVRMYPLMMFLGIWAGFSTYEFFLSPRRHLGWAALAALSCLAFLYSHGAGFMILASINSLAAWLILTNRRLRRAWLWLGLQAVVVALYVPWLIHARQRGVDHPLVPTITDVVRTLYHLLAGFRLGGVEVGWLELVPVMLLAVSIVTAILRHRRHAGLVVSFVLVPLLFCYAVSHLVKPIWFHRTLAYTIPYICLTFSLAIVPQRALKPSLRSGALRAGLGLLIVAMLLVSLTIQKRTFEKTWDLRDAANYVEQEAVPGDLVLIPSQRVFWGWAWYFVGPGSIDPLVPASDLWAADHQVRSVTGTSEAEAEHALWFVYRSPEELGDMRSLLDMEGASIENWSFSLMQVTRIQPPPVTER